MVRIRKYDSYCSAEKLFLELIELEALVVWLQGLVGLINQL